ncbi:hypothetical protein [Breoghania sp. JC706]|uniref:hypothetical protein n=1 Tax=Breoghania sp. JC706 TaxID=3117732 RepID=UPI00300B6888
MAVKKKKRRKRPKEKTPQGERADTPCDVGRMNPPELMSVDPDPKRVSASRPTAT